MKFNFILENWEFCSCLIGFGIWGIWIIVKDLFFNSCKTETAFKPIILSIMKSEEGIDIIRKESRLGCADIFERIFNSLSKIENKQDSISEINTSIACINIKLENIESDIKELKENK